MCGLFCYSTYMHQKTIGRVVRAALTGVNMIIAVSFVALSIVGEMFDDYTYARNEGFDVNSLMLLIGIVLAGVVSYAFFTKKLLAHAVSVVLVLVGALSWIFIEGSSDVSLILLLYLVMVLPLFFWLRALRGGLS